MTPDWLRAHMAAERFGVSRQKLWRWAEDGRITRSTVDGMTFYDAASIAALIGSGVAPQMTTVAPRGGSWRDHPLFRGKAS